MLLTLEIILLVAVVLLQFASYYRTRNKIDNYGDLFPNENISRNNYHDEKVKDSINK